ncbi:MAG: restriction endonuclease subunit S [Clostridia bacterium]|nr:restriction endonuclease subunit S [Clostridia bacterium]
MNLDITQWKEFKLSSIFTIHNGKGITKEEIEENAGDFTVVQSGEENNGVLGKISRKYCEMMDYTFCDDPCLTVARSGSAGFVSFQIDGCVVGDSAKILLLDKSVASVEIYVFLQTLLSANRFKYAYGRKVTESKYMNEVIKLPIQFAEDGSHLIDATKRYSDDGFIPDWKWMENYIKTLHHRPLTTRNAKSDKAINIDKWQDFEFGKLISKIYKAKAHNKDDLTETNNPVSSIRYITRTAENNGCELIVSLNDIDSDTIEEANAITIGDTTATCFYQDEKFIAGDHMVVVRAEWLNKARALFILSILRKEQYKYSYGRAFLMDRIKSTTLKLPIVHNDDGTPYVDETHKFSDDGYVPDWTFMENYIKSLPYGDRI